MQGGVWARQQKQYQLALQYLAVADYYAEQLDIYQKQQLHSISETVLKTLPKNLVLVGTATEQSEEWPLDEKELHARMAEITQ